MGKILSSALNTVAIAQGGTGATTAGTARTALGAAASGGNTDITGLTGLTTPLGVAYGGTGTTTVGGVRSAIGAAASGANSDITALSGLTTALSVGQGGTGQTVFPSNALLLGNGASGVQTVAAAAAGYHLRGTGTGSAPVFGPFNAADLVDESVPYLKIQDLSITTDSTTRIVGINAGGVVRTDGGGVTVANGQTITIPTSASVNTYVGIYVDNSGTLGQTAAAATQALATAAGTIPYVAGWMYVPQNCTGFYVSQGGMGRGRQSGREGLPDAAAAWQWWRNGRRVARLERGGDRRDGSVADDAAGQR